jgi:hypothetical protein
VAAIQPVLAAFPVGQIPTADPLQDIVTGTRSSYINEYFGNVRFDYILNSRNSVYVRYSRDQGAGISPSDISGSGTYNYTVPQNAVVDLTSQLTPTIINNFKLGYNNAKNRFTNQGVNLPGADISTATITIGGANQSGRPDSSNPPAPVRLRSSIAIILRTMNWRYRQSVVDEGYAQSEVRRRDQSPAAAYGFDRRHRLHLYEHSEFSSERSSQVQYTGDLNASPSPFHDGVIANRVGTQYFVGAYFQDEWRVRRNLTVSAGLRYDYFSPLKEEHDLLVNVDTITGLRTPGDADPYHAEKLGFSPRLALTWSPSGNRTVFRIGAGYYRGPGQGEDQNQPILNDVVNQTFSSGASYPIDRPALLQAFNPNDPNGLWQPVCTPRTCHSGARAVLFRFHPARFPTVHVDRRLRRQPGSQSVSADNFQSHHRDHDESHYRRRDHPARVRRPLR